MPRRVLVNGSVLNVEQLDIIDRSTQSTVNDGAYWYDRKSGAWGADGGPCRRFLPPDLDIGGRLQRDASHGTTGVIVNGRELHLLEVAALQRIGPVYRGHYWIDAEGTWGLEGGPAQGNLAKAAAELVGVPPVRVQRPATLDDRIPAEV